VSRHHDDDDDAPIGSMHGRLMGTREPNRPRNPPPPFYDTLRQLAEVQARVDNLNERLCMALDLLGMDLPGVDSESEVEPAHRAGIMPELSRSSSKLLDGTLRTQTLLVALEEALGAHDGQKPGRPR
jgi:hypothetical protein